MESIKIKKIDSYKYCEVRKIVARFVGGGVRETVAVGYCLESKDMGNNHIKCSLPCSLTDPRIGGDLVVLSPYIA